MPLICPTRHHRRLCRAALTAAAFVTALPAIAAPAQPGLLLRGETRDAARQRIATLAAHHAAPGLNLPAIITGRIATPTVTIGKAPALPQLDIKYKAPDGLANISFLFFSPSGKQTLQVNYSAAAPGAPSGTLSLQNTLGGTLGLWSESGVWQLTGAEINGFAGEEVYYTGTQLAAIFPSTSFTLVNRNPGDIVPPVVTGGAFLTPTISLSNNAFAAGQITATDDVSGAATVEIDILSPTQQYYAMSGSASRPAKAGMITAGFNLNSIANPPTGSWSIIGYVVTDAAGNYVADYKTADIQALFGTTTFNVTN